MVRFMNCCIAPTNTRVVLRMFHKTSSSLPLRRGTSRIPEQNHPQKIHRAYRINPNPLHFAEKPISIRTKQSLFGPPMNPGERTGGSKTTTTLYTVQIGSRIRLRSAQTQGINVANANTYYCKGGMSCALYCSIGLTIIRPRR